MVKKSATLIGILIVAWCLSVQAQGLQYGTYQFLTPEKVARLSFEPELDHVILTATINGKENARFILDTGMPIPGIILIENPRIDRLGLNFVAEIPSVAGPGGNTPSVSKIAESLTLTFPGLKLSDITAIVESTTGSLAYILQDVDGIIGSELFSQFAVTVDFDKHEIVLVEPERFKVPAKAEQLPLMIRGGFPWLACSAEMTSGMVVPLELVVDIGASHAISLNVGTHPGIVPPDDAIDALLGRTVTGPIYGKIGRILGLRLGDLELKNIVSSFQTGPRHGPSTIEKHGNLGGGVLRRFNVTFDYQGKRMILEPNQYLNEPFEYNMSGLECSKTPDGTLKIDRILDNSPAKESELRAGDTLHEINGQATPAISMDKLRRILSTAGRVVELRASSSSGSTKRVTLTLRRII